MSPLIDCSGNQQMRKLTLLSSVNMCPSKHVSISRLFRSETNEAIYRSQCRLRKCPLSNQLIPLPLNDDTAVSGGNEVSVSESEVSSVSGGSGVFCNERVVWLQTRHKKRNKSPFFSTKKVGKKANRPLFNIHLFYIQP